MHPDLAGAAADHVAREVDENVGHRHFIVRKVDRLETEPLAKRLEARQVLCVARGDLARARPEIVALGVDRDDERGFGRIRVHEPGTAPSTRVASNAVTSTMHTTSERWFRISLNNVTMPRPGLIQSRLSFTVTLARRMSAARTGARNLSFHSRPPRNAHVVLGVL